MAAPTTTKASTELEFVSGMSGQASEAAVAVQTLSTTDNAVFGDFCRMLDIELKCLHGSELGVSARRAEQITPGEEALLWTNGQFGTHNAKVILNTV